jgi:hypothetical protein
MRRWSSSAISLPKKSAKAARSSGWTVGNSHSSALNAIHRKMNRASSSVPQASARPIPADGAMDSQAHCLRKALADLALLGLQFCMGDGSRARLRLSWPIA